MVDHEWRHDALNRNRFKQTILFRYFPHLVAVRLLVQALKVNFGRQAVISRKLILRPKAVRIS